MVRGRLGQVLRACALVLGLAGGEAGAQHLFKCGAAYQDRPCPAQDVQQRYSSATGFTVQQVNPDTDKDCARVVSHVFPFWQRMAGGESFETLKAEFDARPIARAEKSQMRDLLLVLREHRGTPKEVRSHLETQCMAYKRRQGMPTERQLATAAELEASEPSPAESRAHSSHPSRFERARMRVYPR